MRSKEEIKGKMEEIVNKMYSEEFEITTRAEEAEVIGWKSALRWVLEEGADS